MKRSQRGAARVSVTWLIVFLVLFLIGCVFGYMGYEDAARFQKQAEQATKERDTAVANDNQSAAEVIAISEVVGWVDPSAATPKSNVTALKSDFDAFKSTFPDMGPDIKSIDSALRRAADAYLQKQRELGELNNLLATARSEKDSIEQSLRDAVRAKEGELSNLQKQLSDEQNNAAQRQTELEGRLASMTSQRSELDAKLREARNEIEATQRKSEEEKQAAETRMKAISKTLQFQREPEAVDGKVISVSKSTELGFIDIGAQNRLARGTRFRVVSGTPGAGKIKGWAEVTDVKPSMAEVRFYNVVDRFDPIVSGDTIYNPLYDPKGERTAVLAGRFSGQFNESELKTLLQGMAITVQDRLANDTDYLIVGSELYIDEEGQPLENPLPPEELAVYKNAESQGTQIVSIKQLREYFKF